MPLAVLIALATVSLIGLSIAVVTTVRAESRHGTGTAALVTYRPYAA